MLRIIGGFVCAFAVTTRKRLVNKSSVENRVSQSVDGMLHHKITECRCVNDAFFWLINVKLDVWHWLVCAAIEFVIKRIQIACKPARKLKAGAFFHLPMAGINPCLIQGFTAESLIEQIANALQDATPRLSTAIWPLLGKRCAADFALGCPNRGKTSPLEPPSTCVVRGESESERNP